MSVRQRLPAPNSGVLHVVSDDTVVDGDCVIDATDLGECVAGELLDSLGVPER